MCLRLSSERKIWPSTLATKLAVRVNDEPIIVDPLVLFQRLLKTAQSTPETIPTLFKYELTNLPCALFDASGPPRQVSKSTLAEYLWSSAKEETTLPNENIHFVFDGCSLLHKLPWQRGSTYNQLAEMYAEFVARKYKNTTIVFDGYSTQQTTKAATHVRRHGTSVQVNFTGDMILQDTREKFLAPPSNKQRFINLLSETLMKLGFQIHHAKDDADCLIVKTTLGVGASFNHCAHRRRHQSSCLAPVPRYRQSSWCVLHAEWEKGQTVGHQDSEGQKWGQKHVRDYCLHMRSVVATLPAG